MRKQSIAFIVAVAACYGQSLSAPHQTIAPGQTVAVSLSLSTAGQSIAAIQFDLQWDSSLNVQVTPGDQLRAVSKVPYVASLLPLSVRCLAVGLNQAGIADGELLKLFLSANSASAPGAAHVRIVNVVATDPTGIAVGVGATAVNVQIQNSTGATLLPASAVLNAASFSAGPLSPGEIVTILGFPALPPVSVLIGGLPAPILYAGANQINAIVPFGLDLNSAASLSVTSPRQQTSVLVPVAAVTPAIFTANGSGLGPGAILNEDYTPNTFDHPALPGSVVMVYGTGFGTLQSAVTDGQVVANATPATATVTATVAGVAAEVLYAGSAPGLGAGVIQITVRLPAQVIHNPAAPLVLQAVGFSTPSGVTVTIQ